MNILGISSYRHDSAAVLIRDVDIVAAMPVWLKEKIYLKSVQKGAGGPSRMPGEGTAAAAIP